MHRGEKIVLFLFMVGFNCTITMQGRDHEAILDRSLDTMWSSIGRRASKALGIIEEASRRRRKTLCSWGNGGFRKPSRNLECCVYCYTPSKKMW